MSEDLKNTIIGIILVVLMVACIPVFAILANQ
jgi:hypothetical protein